MSGARFGARFGSRFGGHRSSSYFHHARTSGAFRPQYSYTTYTQTLPRVQTMTMNMPCTLTPVQVAFVHLVRDTSEISDVSRVSLIPTMQAGSHLIGVGSGLSCLGGLSVRNFLRAHMCARALCLSLLPSVSNFLVCSPRIFSSRHRRR